MFSPMSHRPARTARLRWLRATAPRVLRSASTPARSVRTAQHSMAMNGKSRYCCISMRLEYRRSAPSTAMISSGVEANSAARIVDWSRRVGRYAAASDCA